MSIATVARRLSPILALVLTLSLALLPTAGAPAQSARAQKSSCSSSSARRTYGTIAGRCVKHAAHKTKHRSHKPSKHKQTSKKRARKRASKVVQTPAECEDGSLPTRADNGAFSCQDGSEPSCESGSSPTRSSSGAALLCPVLKSQGSEEAEEACEQEAEGECPGTTNTTWSCEEGSEACQADSGEESED